MRRRAFVAVTVVLALLGGGAVLIVEKHRADTRQVAREAKERRICNEAVDQGEQALRAASLNEQSSPMSAAATTLAPLAAQVSGQRRRAILHVVQVADQAATPTHGLAVQQDVKAFSEAMTALLAACR